MNTTRLDFLRRLAAGCVLLAAAGAAHAQALDKPMLLIASPKAHGSLAGAVVLAVPAKQGHLGFILNRVSHVTLAGAFPDEPRMAKLAEPIYAGGPNDAQRLFAVVRRDPGEGSRPLFGDVFIAVGAAAMDRVIQEWPGEARYYAGFAAWDADALAQEIGAGEWLVTEPDAAQLFSQQPADLWPRLVQRMQNTL
jgi:putative transcriptional regulator